MSDPRPDDIVLPMDNPGADLWFTERPEIGLDSTLSLRLESILEHRRSEFQEIVVFRNRGFGTILALDGIIQTTEYDETGYHEMIVHVPLLCHPNPRRVLVIGGGDGGAIREVLKHPEVERVVLCEIDPQVVEVCRAHLPKLSGGLTDPRVEIIYQDGAKYAADHPGSFEVVVVDSSDPIGPAEVLFRRPFYESLAATLAPDGVAVTQAESFFFHPRIISGLYRFIPKVFPVTAYYVTHVPTYPSGLIGFTYCSKGPHPTRGLDPARAARLQDLEYYSPAVHKAAFALPPRALKALPDEVRQFQESLID